MIPIRNLYYMLAYAFQTLREAGYKQLATEEFRNAGDLCAAILARGVSMEIRRGLNREYLSRTESLSCPRGRIEMRESVSALSLRKRQIVCTCDEFSVNAPMNRILKTTMSLLIRGDIQAERRRDLCALLPYFADVDTVDPFRIDWHFRYSRNTRTYQMLLGICELVIRGLLQGTAGTMHLIDFVDEQQMSRLYEKFLLAWYRRECPELSPAASHIPWYTDDGYTKQLPVMRSDITLSHGRRVLIVDAKYYTHIMQSRFDSQTIRSLHLYQIFTYVKNQEASLSHASHQDSSASRSEAHTVSGLLLYARTDEEVQPDHVYSLSGNRISVRTLDLRGDFAAIAAQLRGIAREHFEEI